MINLRGGRFTDIMPENLASQLETKSFAYALGRQIEKLCTYADGIRIYADIDSVPEGILDILAVELSTPAYQDNFLVHVKRELIAGTLPFYQRLGTSAAVEWIIEAVYGKGQIDEWFEYGGEPHHFRIHATRDHAATSWEELEQFLQAVYLVKRLSSWLDEITTTLHLSASTLGVGGTMSAVASLPAPEKPDRFDFRHTLRLWGTMSAFTTIPIPERRDRIALEAPLSAGGRLAVRTSIPVPEAET